MKTDYYNRGWRIFIISLYTGLLTLIIYLISPPLPEGREYIFIQVPVMSGIVVTLFWIGLHEIKTRNEDGSLTTGITSICGAVLMLSLIFEIFNIKL